MSALEQGSYISKDVIDRRRTSMIEDVWIFIKVVCGHGSEDIARFHRPLAYLLAGDAIRLAACLNVYKSEVVTQIRSDLTRRGIDWNTTAGVRRLKTLISRVNVRISRSMGKTTIGLDVLLWKATVNPDARILIVSKSDDAAWAMCEVLGNIMKSEPYQLYFDDRFEDQLVTKKYIKVVGRSIATEDTIEARGATSQSFSRHYTEIYCDDLSSTEAKQGEATIEDAKRFMASSEGISLAERFGGTRQMFVGTIQSARDDHSVLITDPNFISIVVPIWRHPLGPWTVRNMMEDGIPTLPELYDVEACRAKRDGTLKKATLGRISWLQNFLMCAHETGSMQFTAELIKNQTFTWINVTKDGKTRRLIRRYLYEKDESDNFVPKRNVSRAKETCRCSRACGFDDHEYVQLDPLALPRTLGVDQSLSPTGDDWGVGVTAIDSYGHKYQLRGAYDKGYWKMVAVIPIVFKKYGGLLNPPTKIGIESNVWQSMSADWMKRSEEMQFLARRIHKLPPTYTAKVVRIYNDVFSGLEDGTLWLDPDDQLFQKCCLDYNAADPDKQWDDPLDAVAMSIQTHKHAASDLDDATLKAMAQEQERAFAGSCDSGTWIDTSTDFMQGLSWTN